MRFYTIQNDGILIAYTQDALTRFYEDVFELPEDYEKGKYIIGEKEIEIEVPNDDDTKEVELDDNGTPIEKPTTKTITKTVKVLVLNPDWEEEESARLRQQLYKENSDKAKQAVEQGYVEFNDAKFETNTQTVSDLTSAMLIMQSAGMETYPWLSMDDKYVELTLEDFGSLGGLIAGFKAHIWNTEYIEYKTQIAMAQTVEELRNIVISY